MQIHQSEYCDTCIQTGDSPTVIINIVIIMILNSGKKLKCDKIDNVKSKCVYVHY